MKALIVTIKANTPGGYSELVREETVTGTCESILNDAVAKYKGEAVQVTPNVYKVLEEVNKKAVFVIFVPEE